MQQLFGSQKDLLYSDVVRIFMDQFQNVLITAQEVILLSMGNYVNQDIQYYKNKNTCNNYYYLKT